MANRTMQQKELKLKKQRRLFPRSYSADFIPVGKLPSREVLSEFSQRARSGLAPQFSRSTTDLAEAEERARRAFVEAMFPSWYGHNNNAPRATVIRQVEDMLKDVPLERHVILTRTKLTKIVMFFSVDAKKFYFVKTEVLKDTIQSSINYGSRDRALDVFRRCVIEWKKAVRLHDEVDFPPTLETS